MSSSPSASGDYVFGPFLLEIDQGRLTRDGVAIRLPPKALDLLVALVSRAGQLVTKEELLSEIWPGTFVEEANLSVNMATLRRLLGEDASTYIETVPKRGYRFVAEIRLRTRTLDPVSEPETGGPRPLAPAIPPLAAPALSSNLRRAALWSVTALVGMAAVLLLANSRRGSDLASVRSILVTPFRSIDATSAQSYLEVGMAESLATRLGRIDRLRVPPLAAVRADEDLFAAARRLSIDAVLSGSVQRDADRLRVTAQLSRAGDGQILWNESFDQSFTDIFAVQDAIAERLAAGVVRGLSSSDRALLTRRYTSNAEAYDLYLRAREQWTRRTPEAVRAAIRMYDNAIALDPSFALAYAGLADAYNITRSGLPAAVRYPLAKGAAERAVALDPHLSEAHTSLGFLRYKFEQNWPDAEAEFVRAIELNPINALARHWHAESLFLRGRYDESLGEYRRALELDPFSTALYYDAVRCAVRGGKVGEARSLIDDALALAPQEPRLQDGLSMVLFAEGRHREGMEALAQYLVLDGYTVAQAETLRAGFAHGGMTAMYAAWITLLEPRAAKGASQAATLLAETYGRLGDHARALQWLKRAFDLREDARIRLVSNAGYDSLRSRPEFQAFLREAGFPGETKHP